MGGHDSILRSRPWIVQKKDNMVSWGRSEGWESRYMTISLTIPNSFDVSFITSQCSGGVVSGMAMEYWYQTRSSIAWLDCEMRYQHTVDFTIKLWWLGANFFSIGIILLSNQQTMLIYRSNWVCFCCSLPAACSNFSPLLTDSYFRKNACLIMLLNCITLSP